MDRRCSQPRTQKGEAMSRHLLFALLLASVVALAADKPKTQHADNAAAAKKKTEAAQVGTGHAQSKAEPAQRGTEKAQAKTEEARGHAEDAQGQAEEAQAKPDEGSKLTSV